VGNLIIITKGEKLILNYNNNKLGLKHQEQELINLLEDEKEQKIIIDYLNMILLNHPDPTIYQLIYGAKDWLLKKNYENAANWLCPLLPHIQDYSINYENLISQSEQEKLLGVNNLLIEDEIEIENYRSML
jgi:hypothetical protein